MDDDATYLLHIRDACERIESYTTGGREVFLTDRKTQDAVIRNVEVIGEATKNLSTRFRQAHPDVPWRRMAGMRDRVIHGYFGVDLELVWEVVERHLPPLKDRIDRLLGP